MTTIDITLPDELTAALAQPKCIDLQLPKPEIPSLMLPTGGAIKGMADFTRGIPSECSMHFNLMAQIAPVMASMECLLKLLKFVGSIAKAAESLNPIDLLHAILDGAKDLKSCVAMATPAGLFCFVKGLLDLVLKMLKCVLDEMNSILGILDGIQIDLTAATRDGNEDRIAALQCAQENASIAADSTMKSIEPIQTLLSLAGPFLDIANIKLDVTIPSGASSSDMTAMKNMLKTLEDVVSTIKTISDAIPC